MADGSKYEGEWQDGKRHGTGVSTWTDGSRHREMWKKGRLTGMPPDAQTK